MAGNMAQGSLFGTNCLFLHLSFEAWEDSITYLIGFLLQSHSCNMQSSCFSCIRCTHTWSKVFQQLFGLSLFYQIIMFSFNIFLYDWYLNMKLCVHPCGKGCNLKFCFQIMFWWKGLIVHHSLYLFHWQEEDLFIMAYGLPLNVHGDDKCLSLLNAVEENISRQLRACKAPSSKRKVLEGIYFNMLKFNGIHSGL